MSNPVLTEEQRAIAMQIVRDVDSRLTELAGEDRALRLAYLRKVHKELVYIERSSPSKRKLLKKRVWKAQGGICPECHVALELRFSVLDRKSAIEGYVDGNVEVIHRECDTRRQDRTKYA